MVMISRVQLMSMRMVKRMFFIAFDFLITLQRYRFFPDFFPFSALLAFLFPIVPPKEEATEDDERRKHRKHFKYELNHISFSLITLQR